MWGELFDVPIGNCSYRTLQEAVLLLRYPWFVFPQLHWSYFPKTIGQPHKKRKIYGLRGHIILSPNSTCINAHMGSCINSHAGFSRGHLGIGKIRITGSIFEIFPNYVNYLPKASSLRFMLTFFFNLSVVAEIYSK